jgi:hypothetical protein
MKGRNIVMDDINVAADGGQTDFNIRELTDAEWNAVKKAVSEYRDFAPSATEAYDFLTDMIREAFRIDADEIHGFSHDIANALFEAEKEIANANSGPDMTYDLVVSAVNNALWHFDSKRDALTPEAASDPAPLS